MSVSQWLTVYKVLPRYLRYLGIVTWVDLILPLFLILGNSLALSIGVSDVRGLGKRAGLVSTINIMPLFLGGQMNVTVKGYGVGAGFFAIIHRWLSGILVVEGTVHLIVTLSTERPDSLTPSLAAAIAATVLIFAICLSSVLRRRGYEIFINSHYILSGAVIAALYLHNPTSVFTPPTIYLTIAVGLLIVTVLRRLTLTIYRSVGFKKPLSRASIHTIVYRRSRQENIPLLDAVHVHVRLPRKWTYRAGQYINLYMPGVSRTSFAQLHPFCVAWWYSKDGSDYIVLIIEKKHGFTKQLCSHRSIELNNSAEMVALIEGPYGRELDLDSYGTVLLFATGIGIAAQLSYIWQLLNRSQTGQSRTKKIQLYWQVEREVHMAWVADRMIELTSQDVSQILNIQIYVLSDYLSLETKEGSRIPRGDLEIDVTYKAMNVDSIVKQESGQRQGRLAILSK
ncbi:hypothetical protein B0I35DRAFT_495104 [Stachybotrys elegans]|uniref:ferric-chelate reductase (NADPH) n=1 Tax=Stachybotrys elegans TaxID=80388 RepID=A0A8K0SFB0_9HYPO|nr:hypothetical protein B0I35DRAFT_495104 [Stachybotrys elegans]